MPRGKVHFAIEAAAGIGLATALYFPEVREQIPGQVTTDALIAFTVGYLFSLFFISPDLDLARCEARRRWGPFGIIWFPYDKLFRHRGISHSLLFGTATRLIYLAVILGLPAFAVAAQLEWSPPGNFDYNSVLPYLPVLLGFIVGCYIPDVIHCTVDRIF